VAYPYPSGKISPATTGDTAIYGFDISTHDIYGPNWKDLMTYCDNQWVSDFTYEGIRDYMASVSLAASGQPLVRSNRFLVLMGTADLETGTGQLQSVHLIEGENDLPLPEPGDWTIALLDASGRDLATHAFAPHELTRDDHDRDGPVTEAAASRPAVISEIVPWPVKAARVEIRNGRRVVDSRNASATRPSVQITWPTSGQQFKPGPISFRWTAKDADGDRLTFTVAYSNDQGKTWQVLATGIKGTEFETQTDLLPGGADCYLRVIATDGLLVGMDTTGPFYVPSGVPEVIITSPANGAVFYPAQMVSLVGSAYDNEDGQLSGASLQWQSSKDGVLGTGPIINTVDLSTGKHVITLQATDSDRAVGQATRSIEIKAGTDEEPLNLSVMPASLGVARFALQGPVTYRFSVRSSGEDVLKWSVSEKTGWMQLDSAGGSTPSEFRLTVDPSDLKPGTYQGTLTVQSADAQNSPVTVPVVLRVQALKAIYLPIVHRP
jgi:hypothetical protein